MDEIFGLNTFDYCTYDVYKLTHETRSLIRISKKYRHRIFVRINQYKSLLGSAFRSLIAVFAARDNCVDVKAPTSIELKP